MNISLYTISAPVFVRHLMAMSAILDKTKAFCEARKVEESTILGMRIAPDMYPFEQQVRQMVQHAMRVGLLAGLTLPDLPPVEKDIDGLKARIAKAVDFIKSWSKDEIDNGGNREIVLKLGANERHFTGQTLLFNLSTPNFWFHATTAYNIVRHAGVEIGKFDFLGKPVEW